MRFARLDRKPHQLVVELTPMIDVVFLLIIFFLTTARFAQITRADIDLPIEPGEQEKLPEEAGIVINIDRAGKIIVGGNEVSLEELELIVRDEAAAQPGGGDVKLLIRADRNGSTDRLNDVVERLQQIGVGLARLATEVPR